MKVAEGLPLPATDVQLVGARIAKRVFDSRQRERLRFDEVRRALADRIFVRTLKTRLVCIDREMNRLDAGRSSLTLFLST